MLATSNRRERKRKRKVVKNEAKEKRKRKRKCRHIRPLLHYMDASGNTDKTASRTLTED
jgi:hypothetical protein